MNIPTKIFVLVGQYEKKIYFIMQPSGRYSKYSMAPERFEVEQPAYEVIM
jgi:hypothetical protein